MNLLKFSNLSGLKVLDLANTLQNAEWCERHKQHRSWAECGSCLDGRPVLLRVQVPPQSGGVSWIP